MRLILGTNRDARRSIQILHQRKKQKQKNGGPQNDEKQKNSPLSFFFLPHFENSKNHQKQNRKNTPERLEIKKYNKFLKRHTVHKEIK